MNLLSKNNPNGYKNFLPPHKKYSFPFFSFFLGCFDKLKKLPFQLSLQGRSKPTIPCTLLYHLLIDI